MKTTTKTIELSTLPSAPVTIDEPGYSRMHTAAVAAGVITANQRPASITYNHGANTWHVSF